MSSALEIEQTAADWLARRDGATWSDDDAQQLHAWVKASTAHKVAFLRLQSTWQRADRLGSLRAPATPPRATPSTPAQMPMHTHLPDAAELLPPRRHALRAPMRIAAALLLAAGAGALWMKTQPREQQYATAVGKSRTVSLADGSRLQLNTNTRLSVDFSQPRRRFVQLGQGEAFFDVAHDKSRPFVIDAGSRRITVLGTRFSVRRDGDQVAVTVVEGRVRVDPVLSRELEAPAILSSNDEARAAPDHVRVVHRSDTQVANDLAWREGELVFNQQTLAEAAQAFNRYNARQLVIADSKVGQIRIGGRFDADNVQGFARLLHQGFGLTVTDHGNDITVTR
jgi:transmembrane sensor